MAFFLNLFMTENCFSLALTISPNGTFEAFLAFCNHECSVRCIYQESIIMWTKQNQHRQKMHKGLINITQWKTKYNYLVTTCCNHFFSFNFHESILIRNFDIFTELTILYATCKKDKMHKGWHGNDKWGTIRTRYMRLPNQQIGLCILLNFVYSVPSPGIGELHWSAYSQT